MVPLISYSFAATFKVKMNQKSQIGFAIQGCCNLNLVYLRPCLGRELLFGMWGRFCPKSTLKHTDRHTDTQTEFYNIR